MKKTSAVYKVVLEGSDIETKKVQRLKNSSPLSLRRVADEEDTFEICVCHADGKEIDLLSYRESVGIAPYMDSGLLSVCAKVDSVEVKPGKTRAADKTVLTVKAEYEYDDSVLRLCDADVAAFTCRGDTVLSSAVEAVVNGDCDIIAQRPYLNLYTINLPLTDRRKADLPMEFDEGEDYVLASNILFNENFSKCRISSKIKAVKNGDEYEIELDEEEKQTILTFVNHSRIFEGEQGVDCEIEQES